MDISTVPRVAAYTPVDPAKPSGSVETMRATVAAVRALNKTEMMGSDRELQFTRDPVTKRPVIRILRRGTGEVLDQMPPEQVLEILTNLTSQGKE